MRELISSNQPGLIVPEPAPVSLTPTIERLWSERTISRRRGDREQWQAATAAIISEVLNGAVPSWMQATFISSLSLTNGSGVRVVLDQVLDFALEPVDLATAFTKDQRKMLALMRLDLAEIHGLPEDGQMVFERADWE